MSPSPSATTYDIKIDNSALNEYGFTKFSLPFDGKGNNNSSNTTMMTLWHEDRSKIMHCHFYKSDLDRTVKSLEDKLLSSDESIDYSIARSLVTYFRNECLLLREDKTSGFFNGNGNNGNGKRSRKSSSKSDRKQQEEEQQHDGQHQSFFFQIPSKLKKHNISKITKEGSTILIKMNGKAVRFDIEPKWSKTIANFEKQAKGLGINDQKLKQEIIFYLSEQWLKLLSENGNGHTSSNTTTGEQHNGNNNGRTAFLL